MISVEKASGLQESFQIDKLAESLVRVGAPQDVATEIAREVRRQMPNVTHSKHIFKLARRLLRKYNRSSGMRYSLKRAIYALGPSGFPFERYFAKILSHHGYEAITNQIIEGYCVQHEVDVVAANGGGKHMIECKYHNNPGKNTDVKVALYVHARFQDIKRAFERDPKKNGNFSRGWLVTNTRCSGDAIRFAECAGLKIVSWRYPDKESLERMIESKRLYPVTILQFTERKTLEACIANDLILVHDVAEISDQDLMNRLHLGEHSIRSLKKQAAELLAP